MDPGQKIAIYILNYKHSAIYSFILWFIDSWPLISVFLSLLFISGFIYAVIMMRGVVAEEQVFYASPTNDTTDAETSRIVIVNKKWQRVIEHAQSGSDNDWRLAILEADILLDEMLQSIGAVGQTVGERLRSLNSKSFPEIQKAWDAHIVRNQIAHEGANFSLTEREARRVIGLYEDVLRAGLYIR